MTKENFIKMFGECPFKMIRKGYEFTDPEILKLSDDNDWSVAHEMALRGHKFTDIEILKLVNLHDHTVAHVMAAQGHKFSDPEILKLTNHLNISVKHIVLYKDKLSKYNLIEQKKQRSNYDL